MKKKQTIEVMNQYNLLEPFQNKNAGFSRWTYAVSGGMNYFLKEFINPIYPEDDTLSEDLRRERINDCEEYEKKKKALYECINKASHGNMVRISEFFRFDSHYYIATERISGDTISIEELQKYSLEDRLLLCKSIAYELKGLHDEHIVHSDIKDNNIIIKKTAEGKVVGKIIDFDASFFENDPPMCEDELGGDQVYLAPEACQFICGDEVELTCKIDVFSTGLLFHQYLTGTLPGFDKSEYDYAFDAVLDDQKLELSDKLTDDLKTIISGMLECDAKYRSSMDIVHSMLGRLDENGNIIVRPPEPPSAPEPEPAKAEAEKLEETGTEKTRDVSGFWNQAGDL